MSDSSFPSQCHMQWNAQSRHPTVQSPGTRTRHAESFAQWLVHTVSTLSLFSLPPRAGPFFFYVSSSPNLTSIAGSDSITVSTVPLLLFPWLSIIHETKPKFCGLVSNALHNLMPTCFLFHSPPSISGQVCICLNACMHAHARTCTHMNTQRELLLWSGHLPTTSPRNYVLPTPTSSNPCRSSEAV